MSGKEDRSISLGRSSKQVHRLVVGGPKIDWELRALSFSLAFDSIVEDRGERELESELSRSRYTLELILCASSSFLKAAQTHSIPDSLSLLSRVVRTLTSLRKKGLIKY